MWILRIVSGGLLVATLLPFLRTGFWFIRGWDFPRLQVAVMLLVCLLVSGMLLWNLAGQSASASVQPKQGLRELFVWLALLSTAFMWQASHVVKFTPVWKTEIASAADSDACFDVMIVNLKFDNTNHEKVIAQIGVRDPAILVLIEINEDWRQGLETLRQSYANRHEEIRDDGLGIAVWSRLKMASAETKFVVEEIRPSIWTTLLFEQQRLNLIAVHPTPPGLESPDGESRRDSRARDAELISIARHIAQQNDRHWIVAGDFNDVAWSHTTRLFKRISGMRDPRVGRSFIGTYHAAYPLLRFPIDHVFLSDGFSIRSLSRHPVAGSDHFAVSTGICLGRPDSGVSPNPEGDDSQDAREIIDEGVEDAKEQDVLSGRRESK